MDINRNPKRIGGFEQGAPLLAPAAQERLAGALGGDGDRDHAQRGISRAHRPDGRAPVLLTSPVLRPTLYNFLSPMVSNIAVLSYNDLMDTWTPKLGIDASTRLGDNNAC